MQIISCGNCGYTDLIENIGNICPRCGETMKPLGVDSSEWNMMSGIERNALIRRAFPKEEPAPVETAYDQSNEPEEKGPEPAHEEPRAAWEQPPVQAEEPDPVRELFDEAIRADREAEALRAKQAQLREMELAGQYEKVYVCYKCNNVTSHDGARDKYFCPECGSDMIDTGYDRLQWSDLSKEEKRKVSEEAKIRHMVTAIKNADLDEPEAASTSNIINVVK